MTGPRRLAAHLGFRLLEGCNARFSRVGRGPVWDSRDLPWLADLERGAAVVRAEFDRYRRDGRLVPEINETEPGAREVYGAERWNMLHLHLVGHRIDPICRQFPETSALLGAVPGLRHAKFSVLGADRHRVPPHRDGYNGVLRLHLGLHVPDGDCFIRVGDRRVDWQEGRAFAFDPGIRHEVVKEAAEDRVVLIADFMRPAPSWLAAWSRRFYARLGRRPEVVAVQERYRALFDRVHASGAAARAG